MKNYQGPFKLHINDFSCTCFILVGNYRGITAKINAGCFFINYPYRLLPKSPFKIFSKKYEEVLLDDEKAQEIVTYAFKRLDIPNVFYKKGIYPEGKLAFDEDFCYILGVKKDLCYDLTQVDSSKFYAKNYKEAKKLYKEIALSTFKKRVSYWSEVMGISQHFETKLVSSTTYMGINHVRDHKIGFTLDLFAFPLEIIDSVVIHELAHYFEPNHSKDFYEIVLKYCPNYYKYRNLILSGNFSAL